MNGPLLIFDKSALQLLSVDDSAWLDNFFESVITPLFYVETLADLEKKMRKHRTAEEEVKLIAARMPEQQAIPAVHHSTLIASELAGFFKLDADRAKRVVPPQAHPVMLGDSKGIIYRDAPKRRLYADGRREGSLNSNAISLNSGELPWPKPTTVFCINPSNKSTSATPSLKTCLR
jgi:hypothetical protein